MIRKFLSALFLVLVVVSCIDSSRVQYSTSPLGYDGKVINIWVDKNFKQSEKLAIQYSLDQWNVALNGYVSLQVVSYEFDMEPLLIRDIMDSHGFIFLRIQSSNPSVIDVAPGRTLAFVNKIGGNVVYVVEDRVSEEMFSGIMLHEIGHLLGCKHTDGHLMFPVYSAENYKCIDKDSIDQVSKFIQIPITSLNYCIYPDSN